MKVTDKPVLLSIIILFLLSFSGCIFKQEIDRDMDYPDLIDFDFFVNKQYSSETKNYNETHFSSINSALEKAVDNTSIFVFNGIYHEYLVINKYISLIGEDPFNTIIDAEKRNEDVILIQGNGRLTISGFTIQNSSKNDPYAYNEAGIDIRSSGNIIEGNIITNNYYGIYCIYVNNNIIRGNLFTENVEYAAYFLHRSDENIITQNVFNENQYIALRIQGSRFNNVTHNLFINNPSGLYLCCKSENNMVYGNVFCNHSTWNAYDDGVNSWDNGKIGNFWDGFNLDSQGAFDNNSNGIVDIPYSYPLVKSFDNYPLKNVPTISNYFLEKNITSIHCEKMA
ncbi:MAG: NosD domain-containing protein [Candidatus Thermoplasmatota archaeon]|nr:NosD domain-containing protein [Candidatus Thermoplasmatota archaeon]